MQFIIKKIFQVVENLYAIAINNIRTLKKNTFVKNVLTVASGTAIAQFVAILFSPFITRLYGPEAFGILGVFLSLTGVLVPIVALTFPMAIVLPKNDSEAKQIVRLSINIGLIITSGVTLALLLFGDKILTTLGMRDITPFILFIPFLLIFSIGQQVAEQWIIRKKQFDVTAKVSIAQSLILNVSKIGFGIINPKSIILILLTTLGQALYVILLIIGFKKESLNENTKTIKSSGSLKVILKRYKDFPLYRAPQVFMNTISQNLPTIILSIFFGPTAAGFYAIGRRVVSMPSQIIGNAVGNVFYPRIVSASHNKEKLSALVIKATFVLMAVGAVPFGIIIVFGPALFSFIFGEEWHVAGEYARWMSLWMYFGFINNPSVRVLPVISGQKFYLIFTNINVIVSLSMLIVGAYLLNSDINAILLYSIAGVVLNIFLIIIIIRKCRDFDSNNI